ncbi:MAG: hypothetical protein LBQ54_08330, partial [Planctomycetaceae bacterium]|nr:hypothetical protein [Planctomycetaceae bacterium]
MPLHRSREAPAGTCLMVTAFHSASGEKTFLPLAMCGEPAACCCTAVITRSRCSLGSGRPLHPGWDYRPEAITRSCQSLISTGGTKRNVA